MYPPVPRIRGILTAALRTREPHNDSKSGGSMIRLHRLIETPVGFDYSGAHCIDWMQEAVFKDCCVEHLVGPEVMGVGLRHGRRPAAKTVQP